MKYLFKNKVFASFLVLSFVGIAGYLTVYSQISKMPGLIDALSKGDIAKEQAVREVEVSLWETANAIYAYLGEPKELYLKEYNSQLEDVSKFSQAFLAIASDEEKRVYSGFEKKWKIALEHSSALLKNRDELSVKLKSLFKDMDSADDVLDYKIQTRFVAANKATLAKEQAVREVEVSLWEVLNAIHSYVDSQNPDHKNLFEKQVQDVNEFWSKYNKLATTAIEQTHINEFNRFWNEGLSEAKEVIALNDKIHQDFGSFWQAVAEADDIIDFQLQDAIFKKSIAHNNKQALIAARNAKVFLLGGGLFLLIFALGGGFFLSRSQSQAPKKEEENLKEAA